MARDWSLARFVRLYVSESADEAAWDWQARCVWPLLIKAADRAGVIETTKAAKGLAAVIRMPLEVVTPAVDELVADGCLVATPRGYILRNYVEAQTAKMAGSQRQAEYKARERARAALDDSDCNGADTEVTRGDMGSREVTRGDAEVTPIRDDPRRAEQREEERERDSGPAAPALKLTPTTGKPVRARKRPSTTLPDDFAPTTVHRAFCATNGLDLDREAERFRLHHTAKGSTFSSWSAALSTWLHNAVEFGKRAGPPGARPQPRPPLRGAAAAFANLDPEEP